MTTWYIVHPFSGSTHDKDEGLEDLVRVRLLAHPLRQVLQHSPLNATMHQLGYLCLKSFLQSEYLDLFKLPRVGKVARMHQNVPRGHL